MKSRILAIITILMLSLPVQVQAVDGMSVYKQPVSKRKIAKKFLLAMGGVGASSVIIFLMLSLYNRVREGFSGSKIDDNEPSLETPTDLQEAVRSFLNKTNWKG